jgi:hypothetical protein
LAEEVQRGLQAYREHVAPGPPKQDRSA